MGRNHTGISTTIGNANKSIQTSQYKQVNTNKSIQTSQYKQVNTNKSIQENQPKHE